MTIRLVKCKSAMSPSRLPGLDWALNPYRGCGHSCAYCYAQDVTRFEMGRPWGEVIEVKTNFVQQLKYELEKGRKGVYGLGTVTDPYQPLEGKHEITRESLKVLKRSNARVSILTKSDLLLRDLDILRSWPGLEIGMSVSCLNEVLARIVEPGATPPTRRLDALAQASSSGINVYLMLAPLIPGFSDSDEDLAKVVEEASRASVKYIMWDKFNPKPLALSRLRRVMESNGFGLDKSMSPERSRSAASALAKECKKKGIRLVDAF